MLLLPLYTRSIVLTCRTTTRVCELPGYEKESIYWKASKQNQPLGNSRHLQCNQINDPTHSMKSVCLSLGTTKWEQLILWKAHKVGKICTNVCMCVSDHDSSCVSQQHNKKKIQFCVLLLKWFKEKATIEEILAFKAVVKNRKKLFFFSKGDRVKKTTKWWLIINLISRQGMDKHVPIAQTVKQIHLQHKRKRSIAKCWCLCACVCVCVKSQSVSQPVGRIHKCPSRLVKRIVKNPKVPSTRVSSLVDIA